MLIGLCCDYEVSVQLIRFIVSSLSVVGMWLRLRTDIFNPLENDKIDAYKQKGAPTNSFISIKFGAVDMNDTIESTVLARKKRINETKFIEIFYYHSTTFRGRSSTKSSFFPLLWSEFKGAFLVIL